MWGHKVKARAGSKMVIILHVEYNTSSPMGYRDTLVGCFEIFKALQACIHFHYQDLQILEKHVQTQSTCLSISARARDQKRSVH